MLCLIEDAYAVFFVVALLWLAVAVDAEFAAALPGVALSDADLFGT